MLCSECGKIELSVDKKCVHCRCCSCILGFSNDQVDSTKRRRERRDQKKEKKVPKVVDPELTAIPGKLKKMNNDEILKWAKDLLVEEKIKKYIALPEAAGRKVIVNIIRSAIKRNRKGQLSP